MVEKYPIHLCLSCKNEIPTCHGNPKFLCDHPTIEPREPRDNDLIYACDSYLKQ